MTTLAELRIQVANDIRDPLMATFPAPQIDALINAGMNEVSRVYPKETIESVTPLAGTYTYAVEADAVFRVELQRNGVFQRYIPENEDVSSQGGWEFWANMLRLPAPTVDAMIPDTDSLDVWG